MIRIHTKQQINRPTSVPPPVSMPKGTVHPKWHGEVHMRGRRRSMGLGWTIPWRKLVGWNVWLRLEEPKQTDPHQSCRLFGIFIISSWSLHSCRAQRLRLHIPHWLFAAGAGSDVTLGAQVETWYLLGGGTVCRDEDRRFPEEVKAQKDQSDAFSSPALWVWQSGVILFLQHQFKR